MHCNQEVRAKKHVEIIELWIFPGLHEVFEHDENMALILFQFCPLRAVPAVFNFQWVQAKALGKLIQIGSRRVGHIKPRKFREELSRSVRHPPSIHPHVSHRKRATRKSKSSLSLAVSAFSTNNCHDLGAFKLAPPTPFALQ